MPPDPLFSSPDPFSEPTPLIEFGPQPAGPKKDTCTCPKKKKKKKSRPRDVCYRGTYRQLRKGIAYTRQEQVPCDERAPKAKRTRKSIETPTWNDTLRDVFQFPT